LGKLLLTKVVFISTTDKSGFEAIKAAAAADIVVMVLEHGFSSSERT